MDKNWSGMAPAAEGPPTSWHTVFIGARVSSRYDGQELRYLLLVLVGAGGISPLGAPAWIGTTITIVGVVGLGVPILLQALRGRTQAVAEESTQAGTTFSEGLSGRSRVDSTPPHRPDSVGGDATERNPHAR